MTGGRLLRYSQWKGLVTSIALLSPNGKRWKICVIWRETRVSSLLVGCSSALGLCFLKARTVDVWMWIRVTWHQGFSVTIRVLHTLLTQIKGIHISFHIPLIILYMELCVHLGSKLHPYIFCFLWSLLLHLFFWNISNYLGAQLFVK